MADAEQVPSEPEREDKREAEGPAAVAEQAPQTQQERAEATLRSIMAGGDLGAETMKLSNEFTDRHLSRFTAGIAAFFASIFRRRR